MQNKNKTLRWSALWFGFAVFLFFSNAANSQDTEKEQRTFQSCPNDLITPSMIEGVPAAGKRVKQQLASYGETNVFHSLYLPSNFDDKKKYPVIFEYAGNGPFENRMGDKCSGRVEDCNLGFGISGGKDFIWVCIPFISKNRKSNQRQWWGDVNASVDYGKQVVKLICEKHGGDPKRVLLCGFSRGSIACNYIGLHDEEIAQLWCGMICHSHYDGVRRWNYPASDVDSALKRLKRLNSIPQFICQEGSVGQARAFLENSGIKGDFTFLNLPFPNHTDQWVLKDLPERKVLRDWVAKAIANESPMIRR
jgi:hypothetical protein